MSTHITWKVEEQPDVPDAELVIVSHAAKERLVKQVPGNVLHHGGVAGEDALGVDHLGSHVNHDSYVCSETLSLVGDDFLEKYQNID